MSYLEELVDFETLKIKEGYLTEMQRKHLHLIDRRFFSEDNNQYQSEDQDWSYETPIKLEEGLFHLHSLFDPRVLEVGAVRRFPQSVNRDYIVEKYFEDKWVSEGNNALAFGLEQYIADNLDEFRSKDRIKLLDIGPCGGAITTLFALRALAKYQLLDKVEVYLLDIVPEVLKITINGDFNIPQEMIDEYKLDYAGPNGERYKELMKSDRVKTMVGDGERLPDEVRDVDIVLAGYVHHHMNLHARRQLAEQTEAAVREGGFIGVVDFYVPSHEEYMKWYKPHFEKHKTPPPVEFPLLSGEQLKSWYNKTKIIGFDDQLERSFMFYGVKESA